MVHIITIWFIVDAIVLVFSKKWRMKRVDYLNKLDNKSLR